MVTTGRHSTSSSKLGCIADRTTPLACQDRDYLGQLARGRIEQRLGVLECLELIVEGGVLEIALLIQPPEVTSPYSYYI
jgi:hypothetical protein